MPPVIVFLIARVFTKSFWLMVLATFFGVLMIAMRNYFRNEIYQEAFELKQRFVYGPNRFQLSRPGR